MSTSPKQFIGACAVLLTAASVSFAQEFRVATSQPVPSTAVPSTASAPGASSADSERSSESAPLTLVQAAPGGTKPVAPAPPTAAAPAATPAMDSMTDDGGVGIREFQGDEVGQVLRLLARQAKINMVVSEAVVGTVTMRLEDVTALQAISIIVKAKSLFMDQIDNVYYIKTAAERTAEPTESDSYQFSYARAKTIAPMLQAQLSSKEPPQVDERTNTVFFRETRSNIDNIRKMLVQIDRPTKQVMIEARLVEVNANPKQSFGINWAGVVGGATNPQTIKYGTSNPNSPTSTAGSNVVPVGDFALGNANSQNFFGSLGSLALGQFAILSVPQMSVTIRALNEDADAEFLANPRVVTADNQEAKIEIVRNQPVPQLNFNEQTATAVFGGFQDKTFGNTLVVRPSVNKDNFITLMVKPVISNKVADATFVFAGAAVSSPIIDTRTLDSNVLIKSGDTLAIGGLLQDEMARSRSKVPLLGDIPVLGYLFQERLNARTKRNLLVFVTPTILEQRYGTGLEDQVNGLHDTGEEYADPNGWRNNAKGAVRLVPTSNRQTAADIPAPGIAPAPTKLRYMSTAKDRDF